MIFNPLDCLPVLISLAYECALFSACFQTVTWKLPQHLLLAELVQRGTRSIRGSRRPSSSNGRYRPGRADVFRWVYPLPPSLPPSFHPPPSPPLVMALLFGALWRCSYQHPLPSNNSQWRRDCWTFGSRFRSARFRLRQRQRRDRTELPNRFAGMCLSRKSTNS